VTRAQESLVCIRIRLLFGDERVACTQLLVGKWRQPFTSSGGSVWRRDAARNMDWLEGHVRGIGAADETAGVV
jgi:hypothetical protein